jgi:hypothetical protein
MRDLALARLYALLARGPVLFNLCPHRVVDLVKSLSPIYACRVRGFPQATWAGGFLSFLDTNLATSEPQWVSQLAL